MSGPAFSFVYHHNLRADDKWWELACLHAKYQCKICNANQSICEMSRKRQAVWDELEAKISAQRTKNDAMSNKRNKKGSVLHEIVVQKHSGPYNQENSYLLSMRK